MHTFTALLAKAGQAGNRARELFPMRKCLLVPLLAVMVLATGRAAHAADSVAIGEAVSLKASSEGFALAKSYPREDFEIEFEVTCNQPGTVFDTVGLNAAPVGSWGVAITGDYHLTFNLWDGQKWHQLVSQATLSRGKPTVVRLVRQGPTARFSVDGKEDAALSMVTPLSGQPVFVGDFKGDEAWGAKYNIHQGLLGSVKVLYLGEPRPRVAQPKFPEVVDETGTLSEGQVASIATAVRKLKADHKACVGVVIAPAASLDTDEKRAQYREKLMKQGVLPTQSGLFIFSGEKRFYERDESFDTVISLDLVKRAQGQVPAGADLAERVVAFLNNLATLMENAKPPTETKPPTTPTTGPPPPAGSFGPLRSPNLKPLAVTRRDKVASAAVDAAKGGIVDTKSGLALKFPAGSLDKSRTLTVYKAQVPVPQIKVGILGEGKAEPLELLGAWDVDAGDQTGLFPKPVEVSLDLTPWKKPDGTVPLVIPAISVDGKRWTYPAYQVKGNRLVFQTRHLCPIAAYVGWKYVAALGATIGLYMYTRGWEGLGEDVGTEMPFLGLEGKGFWWASLGPDPQGYQIYWSTTVAGNDSGFRDEKGFLEAWRPVVTKYHDRLTGDDAQDGAILDQLRVESDALRRKFLVPAKVAEIDHALRTATAYLRARGFEAPSLTLPVYVVSSIPGDCGHVRNPWLGRRYMVFGANNDTDDVYATALHELFHHYQSGYAWQLVERKENLPFVEGSALLLELEAKDDYANLETYSGKKGVKIWNDLARMDVYRDGLYTSEGDLAQHGYGLSWFMEYLRSCRSSMGKDFHPRLLETWGGVTGTLHKTFLWAADNGGSALGAGPEEMLGKRFLSFAQDQILKGMPSSTAYGVKYSRAVFSNSPYTAVSFSDKGVAELGDKQIKPWSIQYLKLPAAPRPKSTLVMRFPGEWFDYRAPGRGVFLRKAESDTDATPVSDLNLAKGISKNPLVAMPFNQDQFLYIVDTGQTGSGWINEYKPATLFALEPPTEVKSRPKEGDVLEVTWTPPVASREGTLVNRYFLYLTATPPLPQSVPLLKISRVPADKNKVPYPCAEVENGKSSATLLLPPGLEHSALQVRMTTAIVAGIPDGGKPVYFESEMSEDPAKLEVTFKSSGYGDPAALVKIERAGGGKVDYYRTTFTAIVKNAKEPCTYQWTCGGKTQTGKTVTFDVLAPGNSLDGQTVSLKVIDADGRIGVASQAGYGGAW